MCVSLYSGSSSFKIPVVTATSPCTLICCLAVHIKHFFEGCNFSKESLAEILCTLFAVGQSVLLFQALRKLVQVSFAEVVYVRSLLLSVFPFYKQTKNLL